MEMGKDVTVVTVLLLIFSGYITAPHQTLIGLFHPPDSTNPNNILFVTCMHFI